VIFVVGMTVLVAGVALIVLPGPAFIVIPAGLGILAIEFEWARRWLKKAQEFWKNSTKADADPSKVGWARKWALRGRALFQRGLKSFGLSKG
jgi:hypothetical protein